MATAFSAPEGYEPPTFSIETWQEDEAAYIQRLADRATMNGLNPLLGKIIRWQRADGYASYMVWQTKPLQLIHLQLGDAYSVEEALIRGLRLADVRAMIEREDRLRALFAKKDGE